jgi:curved DNA-binding protein CbpA
MAKNRVVNHYDNLKVARNAPAEVIRAAYRTLAQQFHPDKFPNRMLAEHRMKIINAAYEVLSDPDRRREHDEWIAEQEQNTEETKRGQVSFHDSASSAVPQNEISRFEPNKSAAWEQDWAKNWQNYEERTQGVRNVPHPFIKSLWKQFLPLFRAAGMIVLIGWILFWFMSNAQKSPQGRQIATWFQDISREIGPSSAIEQRIDVNQLKVSHATYDYKSGMFEGRVANHSAHTLSSFFVSIRVLDCVSSCATVVDRTLLVDVRVPPGQSRDFYSGPIASLPNPNDIPVIRGAARYQWALTSAVAAR